jgi:hypothetical protein
MGKRPFRRVALVAGLYCLFKVGDAAIGALSARFPNSGLKQFETLQRGAPAK